MGHVRNYSIGDAVARFRRMRGEQVLHVIGWDAFGLPAENAAIQNGAEPRAWTLANIEAMRGQLRRLGVGYDWSREIATCEPAYYRWNQWLFLRMLERGIAFRARRLLNWCASCGTVLANEQVVAGRCWRCDSPVTRREFEQWFLRITQYAQELLEGIDRLEGWPDRVRAMQRHWIGRSEGAKVRFAVEGADAPIEVFTTRIDTIHGATYIALALEHPAVGALVAGRPEEAAVHAFVTEQGQRSLVDRFADTADKLGVSTGRYAINPFSGERLPIWVANFVLMDVGTGAIMSVPAHDERDFAFARAYGLPVRPVVGPADAAASPDIPFTEDGVLHDSGPFAGLPSETARARMLERAVGEGFGEMAVTFRIKDWGVSRQRYWGTPIPIVHCPKDGAVPVPDAELPVLLPDNAPLTGAGGSPLALVPSFVETVCPKCSGPARRETDTMDTFVDSAWYYFRYCDPENERRPFDWDKAAPWFPVDLYIGGIEHATMHLIYTRFWTKVMRDLGLVTIDEPVTSLFTQGMVIKDGAKMSKSKGNVVDPDELIRRYGADTARLFSLFAAPPEKDLDWNDRGVEGASRFLNRVWRLVNAHMDELREAGPPPGALSEPGRVLRRTIHETIHRVTEDIERDFHFNTAISAVMELVNALTELERAPLPSAGSGERAALLREGVETVLLLLGPVCPHITEELWSALGHEGSLFRRAWPTADAEAMARDEVQIVVQVDGRVRSRLTAGVAAPEADIREMALTDGRVRPWLDGRQVAKVVVVPGRLVNIVTRG
jgi:leucyl-tRNA synthetase